MRKIIMRECKTKKHCIVEYDETVPCLICGNPVISASMGGFDICPSCDCGRFRNGKEIAKDPHAMLYLLKDYWHVKERVLPRVPTFQEVNDVAMMLSARGVNIDIWEKCLIYLNKLLEDDEKQIQKYGGTVLPVYKL